MPALARCFIRFRNGGALSIVKLSCGVLEYSREPLDVRIFSSAALLKSLNTWKFEFQVFSSIVREVVLRKSTECLSLYNYSDWNVRMINRMLSPNSRDLYTIIPYCTILSFFRAIVFNEKFFRSHFHAKHDINSFLHRCENNSITLAAISLSPFFTVEKKICIYIGLDLLL